MIMGAYFKRDLFDFLKELSVHNNRDWFQANKERYVKQVRDPFLHLIADLGPGLKKIDSNFVADPRPNGGSMMRIYRDIRFSRDKSPYKTSVAAHFWHKQGKEGATPAYYLHIGPSSSFIGGGVWRPEALALKKIRDRIVSHPKDWQGAKTDLKLGSGCRLGGESLKRPPLGYDSDHPLIEDLKRKDFVCGSRVSDREVLGRDFLDLVLEKMLTTAPLLRFLSRAVGLR